MNRREVLKSLMTVPVAVVCGTAVADEDMTTSTCVAAGNDIVEDLHGDTQNNILDDGIKIEIYTRPDRAYCNHIHATKMINGKIHDVNTLVDRDVTDITLQLAYINKAFRRAERNYRRA